MPSIMRMTGLVAALAGFASALPAMPLESVPLSSATPRVPIPVNHPVNETRHPVNGTHNRHDRIPVPSETSKIAARVPDDPPAPEWSFRVSVGSTKFPIGSLDLTTAYDIMHKACGPDGCDGGTPQPFTWETFSNSGHTVMADGAFTMDGYSDNNQAMIDGMVGYVNSSLIGSVECEEKGGTQCMNDAQTPKRDPENAAQALDCQHVKLNQCTIVNYIQVTAYDPDGDVKGQITMNGESEEPAGFDCAGMLSVISTTVGFFEPPPVVEGAMSVVDAICQAFSG